MPVSASASLRHLARALTAATLAMLTASGAEPTTPATTTAPFMRLRDTHESYNGTAEDFTGLTEIRIGWFAPFDANDAVNGDLWRAASLAVEEANAHRPHDAAPGDFRALPIRLVPCWTSDPWGSGVSQLTRMVYNEQPLALLGSIDSASTHLAEQVVAKAQLPLVSPVATDNTATLAGVSWMFSCAPDDTAVAQALAADLLATPRLVVLATTDHESRMTAREIVRELSRRGHLPEFRFDFAPGLVEPERQLQATVEAKPAAVLIVAEPADAAQLTKAIRTRLGAVPIYGGPALARGAFRELAGSAADGVRVPLLAAAGHRDDLNRFGLRFKATYQRAPDHEAVLAYDATRLLIEAIHRAGPNRARIRDALSQLSPWSGIAGPITFDGTGQNRRGNLRLGVICNGSLVAPPQVGTALRAVRRTPQIAAPSEKRPDLNSALAPTS